MTAIVLGGHLFAALLAGCCFFLMQRLCAALRFPGWAMTILSGATLVYVYWLLTTIETTITIGR